ncbi:MAG: LamG-like jellyroll fold domain-containing protein, partial [Actinomycetes bacterium]
TDTETKALTVGNNAPTASFTATPNPSVPGQSVAFDGSASSDSDGTIARYEWDLDGNGTYETDTGTTATTSRTYASAGTVTVALRVTDSDGKSTTTTRSLIVKAATYRDTVLGTTGLLSYWRMGETSGTVFADSKGASPATISGATLGVAGALAGDTNAAASFNGTSNHARAALNLSATSAVTVEFWLRWNAFANDDDLAMEFTSNFNGNAGGFLIDPNAAIGKFGIGIGTGGSQRNTAYFDRPAPGVWHHYTIVMNSAAPAADQIVPYVDGQRVAFTKGNTGTGAGNFANSPLFFRSRNGTGLFGAGALDELAVYNRALDAAAVAEHYDLGTP